MYICIYIAHKFVVFSIIPLYVCMDIYLSIQQHQFQHGCAHGNGYIGVVMIRVNDLQYIAAPSYSTQAIILLANAPARINMKFINEYERVYLYRTQ